MAELELFYDLALRRLDDQMNRVDVLDDKAAKLFPIATGALPIFSAVLALFGRQPSLPGLTIVLLGLSLVSYFIMLFFLYRSIQVGDLWDFRPHMRTLQAYYQAGNDEDTLRQWVANECLLSLEFNAPKIAKKAQNVFWAIVCFPIQAVLLSLAALSTLVNVTLR